MKFKINLAALLPGFLSLNTASAMDQGINPEENPFKSLDSNQISPLHTETPLYLAGHRSHQSHASHASHRSSSGGGYSSGGYTPYTPPQRQSQPLGQQPSNPSYTAPKKDSSSQQKSAKDRQTVIMRVQLALRMEGYYTGAIDGLMGPGTRNAIARYRADHYMPASTGIDSSLLNALGIATP